MLKQTVLFKEHLALGAKMVPFGGWEMPVSYKGIIEEHRAVREQAGLFDIGHMGLLRIDGANALPFIQSVATNDASRLAIGQGQYAVLCNEQGGAVDDILVYRFADHYMIICNASNTEKVLAWLASHRTNNFAINQMSDQAMLSIQGPTAISLVENALNATLAGLKRNHTLVLGQLIVSRTGYTGEDGAEIVMPKTLCADYWHKFLALGLQPCGLGARDTLRLEAGLPLYGHEYDDSTSPIEAGYAWAVKFDKGPFIGREALLKPPQKRLVGLKLEGRAIPRQGNAVINEKGAPLGVITSGTFSPTFKRPIALAYLSNLSDKAFVEIRGTAQPATIVDKAFYKRVK